MAVTVGLVGTGRRAAEAHAPALASSPEITFAGVWSSSAEGTRELAASHGVTPYDRFDDLVADVDAVAFAIPPAVQAEYAADAAHHGKAVLLQRPIAADVAGAEQLSLAVERAQVVSQVALMWRYAPAVRQFLRTEVPTTEAVGGTGRLVSGAFAPGSGVSAWRAERGVLHDEGADLLDLLDAALGPIAGVRAHGDPHGWVGLLLEQQIGHVGEASMYALAPPGAHRAEVEVHGSGGSARVDCSDVVGPLTYERLYGEFAAAVSAGAPHELDVRRGWHLQQVIEAAETDLTVGV
ncbi:MAG TPA: Gfo/Idh/MocA family oxidoreductase [Mycobacteriales bacterium]